MLTVAAHKLSTNIYLGISRNKIEDEIIVKKKKKIFK